MTGGVIAFTIPGQGHISRMLPLVAGLCEMGIPVDFYAHEMARRSIERTGARFHDLYAGRDMDVPDGTSRPVPMRNVSFAGYWGEAIAREAAALRPRLLVHDTFAVIGRVVAFHLGIPRVNMRAGHNLEPNRALAALEAAPGSVDVADACYAAVASLRQRHGIPDASPFSFFIDDGADLNICSEPPEFLAEDQRAPFEPLAFFGSCFPDGGGSRGMPAADLFGPGADSCLRVYVGLGTAKWLMCPERAVALLSTMADALAMRPDIRGLIALGNPMLPPEVAERLVRPNVRVEPYVDQTEALRRASVYVTHHGLNSTHEAVYHRVPMISCPLFGDQPVLAARCQELGLAVPLALGADGLATVQDVHRALAQVERERPVLEASLARAREWEIAVMNRRPEVLRRIVSLMN
jgi:MGT family glycosyltransferase